MRCILFTILLFSSFRLSAHQIPIAFFNVDIEENTMHLMIQFDAEDLDYAVSSYYREQVNKTEATHTSLVSKYVNTHFSIALNQDDISIIVQKIEQEGDHYYITILSTCLEEAIHSIKIKNECLIHEIDQHSNIIRLQQTGQEERGFRLHEGRISTIIQL